MFKPWGRNRFREDSEDADDVDIFSRSEETLRRARAQQDAQRAQKRQKQSSRQDISNRRGQELSPAKAKTASPKRDAADDGVSIESIEGKKPASPRRSGNVALPPGPQSPRLTRSTIIAIDDSDDEDETSRKPLRSKASQPAASAEVANPAKSAQVLVDEDDSDAEIRALAARSRARKAAAAAEQVRLLQTSNSSLSETPATIQSTHSMPSFQPTQATTNNAHETLPKLRHKETSASPSSSSSSDPVVSIFLHSRIPHTSPLIVNRRISQPLRAVRLAFCKTNHLAPDLEAAVFLTWRGRRVFDISSCRSLCVETDAHTGNIYIKGDRHGHPINAHRNADTEDGAFDADDDPAKLEMEVVTQAIFDADRLALQAKYNGTAPPASQPWPGSAATNTPAERRIKIILRGRGYDDYKLTVKPTTLFDQIVAAFRKQRGAPDDKDVYLMFDGERLSESESVGATDIDDMDFIDVHIR